MRKRLLPQVLVMLLTACLPLWAASLYEINSGWVTNGKVALKVDTMTEAHTWDEVGPFGDFKVSKEGLNIPFRGEDLEPDKLKTRLDVLKSGLQSGKLKALIFSAFMENRSGRKMWLGWDPGGGDGCWRLRGQDETEVDTAWILTAGEKFFELNTCGCGVTLFLQHGLPKRQEVEANGSINGRVVVFVPTGFVPQSLYLKSGQWGDKNLVIPIKLGTPINR